MHHRNGIRYFLYQVEAFQHSLRVPVVHAHLAVELACRIGRLHGLGDVVWPLLNEHDGT